MPFFLDGNPTSGEISEAINYLLGNTQLTTSTNIVNGQVTDASGTIVSYLYKYLYVKYADSFDGTVNFSNTPTSRQYYGLRNNDSSTESTNPADYIWYKVAGGFGTTKFVFYSVTGGRRINIVVGLSAPSILYQADSGAAINLDQISGSDGASSRICYAKSASFALASTPTTYQTSGPSGFPPYNTWGGSETWQATPPTLFVNEALFQSDGIYNPTTNLTTWNAPYLSNLKVGALSAITANMGTLTAGEIIVTAPSSATPVVSGTTMAGVGTHLYSDGRFALGNSTTNIVFDGTNAYINGFTQGGTFAFVSTSVPSASDVILNTFTVTKAGTLIVGLNSSMSIQVVTSAAAVIYGVNIYIKNSSGTIVSNTNNIYSASGAPVLVTFGATSKVASTPITYICTVPLSTGTYTLRAIQNTCYAIDGVGNVIAGGVSSVGLASGTASTYQVLA